jgi:hypothetical protein
MQGYVSQALLRLYTQLYPRTNELYPQTNGDNLQVFSGGFPGHSERARLRQICFPVPGKSAGRLHDHTVATIKHQSAIKEGQGVKLLKNNNPIFPSVAREMFRFCDLRHAADDQRAGVRRLRRVP